MKISNFQKSVTNPLTSAELENCKQTARNLPARGEADFIFDIVPYTGLSGDEFVHLSNSWITWPDEMHSLDYPVIQVPKEDKCRYTRWDENPPKSVSKDGSCYSCRKYGNTDDWMPWFQSHAREIPVHEPDAQKALKRYFKTFGFKENPWGPDHRKEVLQRINETSTLSRDIGHQDLVHTFIHICAEVQGLDKDTIVSISRYTKVEHSLKRLLMNSTKDYELNFKPADYLRALVEIEPATCKELAEETNKSYNVARRAINDLVDEEIVIEAGRRDRQYGCDVAEYILSNSGEEEEIRGFQCDECSEIFDSVRGRSKHKQITHGEESPPGS